MIFFCPPSTDLRRCQRNMKPCCMYALVMACQGLLRAHHELVMSCHNHTSASVLIDCWFLCVFLFYDTIVLRLPDGGNPKLVQASHALPRSMGVLERQATQEAKRTWIDSRGLGKRPPFRRHGQEWPQWFWKVGTCSPNSHR